MNWQSYQSAETIIRWLDCLNANFDNKVKVQEVGKSFEGRPLKVIRIGDGDKNKPAVFIDAGIHAR